MKNLIESLTYVKVSHGSFKITVDFGGNTLEAITNNSMAIDALSNFEEGYYDSAEEAARALVEEILRINEIEL